MPRFDLTRAATIPRLPRWLFLTTITVLTVVALSRRRTPSPADPSAAGGDDRTLAPPAEVPPERPIEFLSVTAHLEATAGRRGRQIALRTAENDITYADLMAAVRRSTTVQDGPSAAALVTATLRTETVSTILGLFASGTTVVTVDPATPDNRTAAIAAILAEHGYTVTRVDPQAGPEGPGGDATVDGPGLDDVTSIQFTSGSTGTPKAVLHTHGLWLADAQLLNDRFGLADGRKVALCMPISFAGGLNVLIGSLLGGAEVIGVDPREHTGRQALRRIRESGAEVITCTPAFIDVLHAAAQGETLPHITRIVATGEPIYTRHIRLARELAPQATVTNWVGSTETLAIASYDITPGAPLPHGVIPVGIPAPHKRIHVRDDGAVSITSRHLGAGYLDPAAASASFTVNSDNTTTYAGGDVGRWDPHGNLVLSGRADSTVKIRGYLVEPAEIEVTLLSYDDIREAVVVVDRGAMVDRSGTTSLTAYVAPTTTGRTPAVAELRTRLHRDLPPWMVPTHLVTLPALPRGDRGKIDRGALPKPRRAAFDPPRGNHEKLVSRLWAEVLHVESVGRGDSFYARGGDSMSAMQMLVALREQHGVVLQAGDLASAPTVATFAAAVATAGPAAAGGSRAAQSTLNSTTVALRAVSSATTGTPLFCFTGAGASALCFSPLAERVGSSTAVYAFEPKGLAERAFPDLTIRGAARRHVADLRRIQPHGPYTLVGHSLGAHLALEAAVLLQSEGEDVDSVVMLDPWLPPRVAREARQETPEVTATLDLKNADVDGWWDRQRKVPLAGFFVGGYQHRTLAIEEIGMMSVFFYRPARYSGRTLLFLSHLNQDDPSLWSRVLTGESEFQVVDCDHHSIVREPHVAAVAERLITMRTADRLDASVG